ncbi:MAG TPA: NTP transferase domain-containing protein [Acidimicrobiales bacterium]|nr:NTP transferase domain-containing protein [Acidimicrobiales bacterium]
MSVAAVVLAAGGGRRFSGPQHKLLTPYRGRPLVVAALEAAAGCGADAVAAVGGAVDLTPLLPGGLALLHNPDWEAGLSSSLAVALAWCREKGHDAVVLGLGDMPGVPASAWAALVEADGEVAVANFGGALRPPVRLAATVWDEVPTSGDVGARELWKRPGTVEVACEGSPVDIDTADDLSAFEAAGR